MNATNEELQALIDQELKPYPYVGLEPSIAIGLIEELLQLRKDRDRLEFLLHGRVVLLSGEYYHVASPKSIGPLSKTPREAIDSAIEEGKA